MAEDKKEKAEADKLMNAEAAVKAEAAAKITAEAKARVELAEKEKAKEAEQKAHDQKSADMRSETRKVIVRHLGVHPENEDMPIVVNDMGDQVHGKKIFAPGAEVVLTLAQIGILKNAIQRSKIPIPEDSAILQESNVKATIAKFFKGHVGRKIGGRWYAYREKPNFAIMEA